MAHWDQRLGERWGHRIGVGHKVVVLGAVDRIEAAVGTALLGHRSGNLAVVESHYMVLGKWLYNMTWQDLLVSRMALGIAGVVSSVLAALLTVLETSL